MPPTYRLPFTCAELPAVAARNTYEAEDNLADILQSVQVRGHLTREEFLRIGEWKTRRKRRAREKNSVEYIIAVTRAAFASSSERFRIEALTLLDGVAWPTASVILHFAKDSTYPILDVRALWSLGCGNGPHAYDFRFWWSYVEFCRGTAEQCGVTIRELDCALWQHSKENQGPIYSDA